MSGAGSFTAIGVVGKEKVRRSSGRMSVALIRLDQCLSPVTRESLPVINGEL